MTTETPTTKATAAPRPRHGAPTKAAPKNGPTAKKASPTRKTTGKTATILGLLRRRNGVTLATIMSAVGWQAHSVRGFISLAGSRRGLKITSVKNAKGQRVYKLAK